MSMSDCPKCWDTPCMCGHEYQDWSLKSLKELRDAVQKVINEKWNKESLKESQMRFLKDMFQIAIENNGKTPLGTCGTYETAVKILLLYGESPPQEAFDKEIDDAIELDKNKKRGNLARHD